jgi:hypothetical protein
VKLQVHNLSFTSPGWLSIWLSKIYVAHGGTQMTTETILSLKIRVKYVSLPDQELEGAIPTND